LSSRPSAAGAFARGAKSRDPGLREKRLKRWRRSWKIELIERKNEDWHDLWPGIAQL
jgi:predicted GIY-YIG superfamily endonuclease